MSNITIYPPIPVVAGEDLMIISDMSVEGHPTKTVTVNSLGAYITASGGGAAGVASLNGKAGAVTLVGGTNVTLALSGQNITINAATTNGTVTTLTTTVAGDSMLATVTNATTTPKIAFTYRGSANQYVNGLGNLIALGTLQSALTLTTTGSSGVATLSGSGTLNIPNYAVAGGTVTSVAATFGGDAFGLTGSPITASGTLAIAPAGTAVQYINGLGNLAALSTLQGALTLTTTGTSGAATLSSGGALNIPNYANTVSSLTTTGTTGVATLSGAGALNIPNYSNVVTSITTTGNTGAASLSGSGVLNIPNYGAAYTELFFEITRSGSTYAAVIHRNTTGATFTFARTGTGVYEMQANSAIFSASTKTHFSVMNANRVAPAAGTGILPQPTVARTKSTSLFAVEVFSNNTGTVAGEAADIPDVGGYDVSVEVRIYPI